jgi:phage tail-like protein
MNAPFLPPIARPPHDPRTLVLDARLGWRSGQLVGVSHDVDARPVDQALALQALAGTGRLLGETSGGFGGLALPRHAAWLPDSRLVLLDAAAVRLRVFDPCACALEPYACFAAGDPRLPEGCASVAVVGKELLLCVPGAHRVIVLDTQTGATRAVWTAPIALAPATPKPVTRGHTAAPSTRTAPAAAPWTPVACVGLPHHLVAVADPANGGVHLCSRRGRSLRFIGGLGAVHALAVDRAGRLYVQCEGMSEVVIVDVALGRVVDRAVRPEEVAAQFCRLPLRVFADGAIDVGPCCVPPAAHPVIVDAGGTVLPADHADAVPTYPAVGVWTSAALDSEIAACIWDRVALTASLSIRDGVEIATRGADALLTDDELADPQLWRSAGVWRTSSDAPCATADYMLRSPPGRYLWLKITLSGNTHATPSITCIELTFPRVSLRRYLPAVFGADPIAAEFTDRWLAILDRGLRDIETQIDTQARLFDPLSAPAVPEVPPQRDFLAMLAQWVGVSLIAPWPLERKRRFVKLAPRLNPWRGTLRGLRAALHLFLGLDRFVDFAFEQAACVPCVERERRNSGLALWQPPRLLLEHFQLRRWMALDHARLSDAAKLWGERIVNRSRLEADISVARTGRSDGAQLGVTQLNTVQDPARDPFHLYAHRLSVFVPAACVRDPAFAHALALFIEAEKPAHVEAQLVFVEPRFRVGMQAMLGLDAVIGVRTPPVTLDSAKLGRATVLVGAGSVVPRPPRNVGSTRVGMTTTVH